MNAPNSRTNPLNYRDLFGQLIVRDLKLKYRRSFLGYLWSVLNPLLMMLVMYVIFSNLFGFEIQNYPVYLMSGQIMFNFMNEATSQAMSSVLGNAALLKKTYVPRYIFTVSKVTSALINMLFTMVALVIVILITGVQLSWHALLFVFPVIELYLFCMGLGLFLAQAAVFFRDIQYIWGVLTLAWMYLTPVFYPVDSLPQTLANLIKILNPMYAYIGAFRDLVLYHSMPGYKTLIAGVAWALISMAIGAFSFSRTQKNFILYI